MIYEAFLKWLFRARHCDHDFVEVEVTDTTFNYLKEFWGFSETRFRHIMKCSKCKKKKTLLPREVSSKY